MSTQIIREAWSFCKSIPCCVQRTCQVSLSFVTRRKFGAFTFLEVWCSFFPNPTVPVLLFICSYCPALFLLERALSGSESSHPSSNLLLCHVALAGLQWVMDLICLHNSSVKITLWKFSGHPERKQELSSSFRTLYNWWTLEGKRWDFYFLVGYLGKSYFLTINTRAPFIFDHWGGLLTGLWFLVYVGNSA